LRPGGQPRSRWLRTDEAEDVASSIRHCIACYCLIEQDEHAWKWVALSLHSALQGACVCHLVTTFVPVGAVTKKNTKEWVAYVEASRDDRKLKAPATTLLNLPDLLKKARKPRSAGDGGNASGIAISDSELAWLRRFHNDIRNEFTHFSPKGWAIEVSGIPKLTDLAVRIISDVSSAGWAFRHQDDDWRESFASHLRELRRVASTVSF
jgi:hypothetical protein